MLMLTQIDLAVLVGIDRSYLSGIGNGRVNASICVLYVITDALRVPLIRIFETKREQGVKKKRILTA